MPRPVHFEIHAADPQRAIGFYQALFGWQFTAFPGGMPYWLVKTGEPPEPGIDGGLVQRMGGPPADGAAVNAYVCTVGVASVDDTVAAATRLGGTVALPKSPIAGVGWVAYLKDTEGNLLGLHQADAAAR